MTRSKCSILLVPLALAGVALTACQSDKHTMVEPSEGTVIVCKECYDEIYKVQHSAGSRFGTTYTQAVKHKCPSCRTEMSIYTENGVTKVKCAKCAPEGLVCDKCLPPEGYVPPSGAPSTKP